MLTTTRVVELRRRTPAATHRISVHYFNTRDDIDRLADLFAAAIRAGR